MFNRLLTNEINGHAHRLLKLFISKLIIDNRDVAIIV